MNYFSRFSIIVLVSVISLFAIERVPKQYSLETGWSYTNGNEISNQSYNGFTVMFDYSWQVSGIDGSRAATFITVPIGYSFFSKDPAIGILEYGWTIRHNLLKKERQKPIMPFLGYGLLLNQLSYDLDPGKRIGHQTRFDAGAEFFLDKPWNLFTKAEWSMTRFYDRAKSDSDMLYRVTLKVGVRFCKPARQKKPVQETNPRIKKASEGVVDSSDVK